MIHHMQQNSNQRADHWDSNSGNQKDAERFRVVQRDGPPIPVQSRGHDWLVGRCLVDSMGMGREEETLASTAMKFASSK
jgi:hypothetical protein